MLELVENGSLGLLCFGGDKYSVELVKKGQGITRTAFHFFLSVVKLSRKCSCSHPVQEPMHTCALWSCAPAASPSGRSLCGALCQHLINRAADLALLCSLVAVPPPASLLHFTQLFSDTS